MHERGIFFHDPWFRLIVKTNYSGSGSNKFVKLIIENVRTGVVKINKTYDKLGIEVGRRSLTSVHIENYAHTKYNYILMVDYDILRGQFEGVHPKIFGKL